MRTIIDVSDCNASFADIEGAEDWLSRWTPRRLHREQPRLDAAISSIAALPAIADAVADDAEVLLDGGVRRGTDIVKALALGARACLGGRPVLYGLAAGGEAGARRAVELLRDELSTSMALMGCASVSELTRDHIHEGRAR
jgi:isopentenyl diphosphate isomerase/L-lactate dehydrogenase-like FMN-dependent dehydrogenase